MKYYLKLGFVLLIITVIASGILAFINSFTEPKIIENQIRTKEEARKEVLPQAVRFEPIGTINDEEVFKGLDENDHIVGYTFLASLYGYSSDVKTMVGADSNLTINQIKIISQTETPGLGANCEKPEFQNQFIQKTKKEMKVDKDGGSIISITGATITTRTIANSIRSGLDELEKLIKSNSVEEVIQ